jgi:hypothetical protein
MEEEVVVGCTKTWPDIELERLKSAADIFSQDSNSAVRNSKGISPDKYSSYKSRNIFVYIVTTQLYYSAMCTWD